MCDILDDIKGWRCGFYLLVTFHETKKERETVLIFIVAAWSSTGLLKCGSKLFQWTNLELMLAHGLEMFLLKQQLMFPVYTIW